MLAYSQDLTEVFSQVCEKLLSVKGTVLLTGMGKSGIVARKWSSTFSSTGTRAYFINPAEAPHGDLGLLHAQDILIVLSNSGETEELSFILHYAREKGIPIISVTQNKNSSLAFKSDLVLEIPTQGEACPMNLAPTTSTTIMMALGDALAVSLMQSKNFSEQDFALLHPGGTLGKRYALKVKQLMHVGDRIPLVQETTSLSQVLMEMTEKMLGFTVVEKAEKEYGVITDGDLRRFFQKCGLRESAFASELMTSFPKSVSSEALAHEARALMEVNKIQQLLVFDDEKKLVGVIHFHDLLKAKVI